MAQRLHFEHLNLPTLPYEAMTMTPSTITIQTNHGISYTVVCGGPMTKDDAKTSDSSDS